ncbi:transposase [Pseudogemmobacter bohemicus]|uniref:transposase n=1 Tax=Pseudogemmobacter bohemicus TaxID=2250708 RepID=UPI0022B8106B|nr:transposase [Pseudogemmobacter bohemicus]
METTLEVLPVGGRGRRNRKWPDEVKARIVAATLTPGITVHAVARRHGVPANHVFAWRILARKGRLVLPAPDRAGDFDNRAVEVLEHDLRQ